MKRRNSHLRAATRSKEPRSIRYDDGPALTGGRVDIRRYGTVLQAGAAEVVMPDFLALGLDADPMHERRYFSKPDGFPVWISPRDLQPLIRKAPALR